MNGPLTRLTRDASIIALTLLLAAGLYLLATLHVVLQHRRAAWDVLRWPRVAAMGAGGLFAFLALGDALGGGGASLIAAVLGAGSIGYVAPVVRWSTTGRSVGLVLGVFASLVALVYLMRRASPETARWGLVVLGALANVARTLVGAQVDRSPMLLGAAISVCVFVALRVAELWPF